MKTKKTRSAATLFLIAAVAIAAIFLPLKAHAELETVEEPGKAWEYGVGLGYVDYNWSGATSGGYVDLRAMKRLSYPWLVGPGFSFSFTGDILVFEGNIPLIVRTTVGPIKADFLVRPGAAYAWNQKTDFTKFIGTITGGLELKKFVTKGTSVGLGLYYTGTTYSKLNSFKAGLIIGF